MSSGDHHLDNLQRALLRATETLHRERWPNESSEYDPSNDPECGPIIKAAVAEAHAVLRAALEAVLESGALEGDDLLWLDRKCRARGGADGRLDDPTTCDGYRLMRVPLPAAVLAVVLAILATAWVWSLPRPAKDRSPCDNANATGTHDPYLEGLL